MRTAWLVVGGATVALVATPFLAYRFCTERFANCVRAIAARLIGLQTKSVRVGNTTYAYYHGGNKNGPVVLFLHGFSSYKIAGMRLARHLSTTHQVFCLDQAGHGDTKPRRWDQVYTAEYYAACVREFAQAVGIVGGKEKKQFHIMGESLGGLVSGVYAATYPEDVITATLLCPAGIIPPTKTDFQVSLEKEDGGAQLILVPQTREQYVERFDYVSNKPIKIPKRLMDCLYQTHLRDLKWYEKLWTDLVSVKAPLEKVLPKLRRVPVMVLWGDCDRLLHYSGAEVIRANVGSSNCKIHILKDVGHIIASEVPEVATQLFLQFELEARSLLKEE